MIPFLDLSVQNAEVHGKLCGAFDHVMIRSQFILGAEVEAFETDWAKYCEAEHAVGVASGLDALKLMLLAYGIGEGAEVIVPSNTYVATWLAVSAVGAVPVPVEPCDDFNINPDRVERVITSRTVAVLAVNLYGRCADLVALRDITDRHGLRLLIDAAHSHGIKEIADASAFSFYPTKNLGCLGDGGAVVTNDRKVADKVRALRNYGSVKKNSNLYLGMNSRLDELQAAFLRVKLHKLDEWNSRRRAIARIYDRLSDIKCPAPGGVYHQYVIRTEDRAVFRARLLQEGVQTDIHYPTPPHLQPCYAGLGYKIGAFPIAERMADEVVSLPITATEEQARHVVSVAETLCALS